MVTDPGYWAMLKAETKWMRVVVGGLLLVAGWNLLETAYLAFQGFTGGRWEYDAMLINVLWFSLITAWVELRYWRRRAVAAEERRVDVTTVGPGMLSLHDGTTTPEVLEAMDRLRARRNASYGFTRR